MPKLIEDVGVGHTFDDQHVYIFIRSEKRHCVHLYPSQARRLVFADINIHMRQLTINGLWLIMFTTK